MFLVFITPIVHVDRRKIKQNWQLSHKTWFLYRDWGVICQTDNAAGEVYPILSPHLPPSPRRCRKSHVKEQIQYEITCFSPFLAKRCLHVAYDFGVYSQLLLPISKLSAYTLWILKQKTRREKNPNVFFF